MVKSPVARMMSGANAASSCACLRSSAALAVAQRGSMRTIAADGPAQERQLLIERCKAGLKYWIIRGRRQEDADPLHRFTLLRAGGQRPRDRRTTDKCDELAPPH